MALPIEIECVAVPDGVVERNGERYLRVSVVIKPRPLAGAALDLATLPTALLGQEIELSFRPIGSEDVAGAGFTTRLRVPSQAGSSPAIDPAALWNGIWNDPAVLDAYYQQLAPSPSPSIKAEKYGLAALSDLSEQRVRAHVALDWMAHEYRRGVNIAGVERNLPAEDGDLLRRRLKTPQAPQFKIMDAQDLHASPAYSNIIIGDALDELQASRSSAPAVTIFGAALSKADLDELGGKFADARAQIKTVTDAIAKSATDPASRQMLGAAAITGAAADWNPIPRLGEEAGTRATSFNPARPMRHAVNGYGATGLIATASANTARIAQNALGAAFAPDPSDEAVNPPHEEAAARRIAALQAHPTLRKLLNLIIDVEIRWKDLADAGFDKDIEYGVVTATIGAPARNARSTFTLRSAKVEGASVPNFFEPCPRWQYHGLPNVSAVRSATPALPLDDGIVDLSISAAGGNVGRFLLRSFDPIAASLAERHGLSTTLSAKRNGATLDQVPTDEVSRQTRGIYLFDTETHVTAQVAVLRAEELAKVTSGTTLLYAEDLVDGYRLDVVSPSGEAYPAGARALGYTLVDPASPPPVIPLSAPARCQLSNSTPPHPFPEFAARDEGFIALGARVRDETDGSGRTEINQLSSEALLCWTGNLVGMPAGPDIVHKDEYPTDDASGGADLPVHITYAFHPKAVAPILRDGKQYKLMLRARKINGSSVSTAFAQSRAGQLALGDGKGLFRFAPLERTPGPDILIPEDEAIVSKSPLPNEAERDLVIRTDNVRPRQPMVRRVLVSPRIGSDAAERAGLFDGEHGEDMLHFGHHQRIDLDADGNYRQIIGDPKPPQKSIGALYRAQAYGPRPRTNPFWCDPSIRFVGATLKATGATGPDQVAETKPGATGQPLWRTLSDPLQAAQPVCLEVKAGSKSGIVQAAASLVDGVSMPTLRVEVAPAHTLELEVWLARDHATSFPEGSAARQGSELASAALDVKLATGAQAEANWLKMASVTRFNSLHTVTRFKVEHHVPRPLAKPQFAAGFKLCRAANQADWEAKVALGKFDDTRGAQRAYVTGAVTFDRKSTGQLWCRCAWLEDSPAEAIVATGAVKDPHVLDQPGLYKWTPPLRHHDLLDIDHIRAVNDPGTLANATVNSDGTLDLLRDEGGALRLLRGPFEDTRARRIVARLVARTRFDSSYPDTHPLELIEESARHDTLEEALRTGKKIDGVLDFWISSTEPPPPVVITKPKASSYDRHYVALEGLPANMRGTQLRHKRRLWLGSDWHASGPEKLAIICVERPGIPDLQGLGKDVVPLLSRWGTDMTMRAASPLLSPFLPAASIADATILQNVPFPKPRSGQPSGSRLIDLALLEPEFDESVGEWFCALDITVPGVFRPWITLGLMRYQEHAIDGCQFSEPVVVQPFILPQPWDLRVERRQQQAVVTATGPAYIERAPSVEMLQDSVEAQQAVFALCENPIIHLELEDADGAGGPAVIGDDEQFIKATSEGNPLTEGKPGFYSWTKALPLPEPGRPYAVRAGVASVQANAAAQLEESEEGAMIQLPDPYSWVVQVP